MGCRGVLINKCPMLTYFHMGKPHTIIGAERFHFRVRNGFGWFPLAMVTGQNQIIQQSERM